MRKKASELTLFDFFGLRKNGDSVLIGQPNSKQAGDLHVTAN